jgi:hypothetical protein
MLRFLRNFFSFRKKTEAKVIPLYPKKEDFENIEAFLANSEDLYMATASNSRSTRFFKEADNILIAEGKFMEDSNEMLAMQDYLGAGANFEEQEEKIEQDAFIKSEKELMGLD